MESEARTVTAGVMSVRMVRSIFDPRPVADARIRVARHKWLSGF
jgi:hypothetical protein